MTGTHVLARPLALLFVLAPPAASQQRLFGDPHSNLAPEPVNARGLATGDLDGDGDQDFLVADHFQSAAYFNAGEGAFQRGTQSLKRASRFVLFDVDQDGDLDAAGTSPFMPVSADYLYENAGGGTFLEQDALLPQDGVQSHGLEAFDLDQDGKPDLYFAKDQQDRCYRNAWPQPFEEQPLPVNPARSYDVAAADVDLDGDPDVVIGHGCPAQASLYGNQGPGLLVEWTALPWPGIWSLALGDVDGDGDPDLLANDNCLPGPGTPRLLLNDGVSPFQEVPGAFEPAIGFVRLADVDRDLDLDAVVLGFEELHRIHRNDGLGVFGPPIPVSAVPDQTLAGELCDVDQDGDPDLLLGNYSWRGLRLHFNDGTGAFGDSGGNVPDDRKSTTDAALGDVDQDGDLDAILANGVGAGFGIAEASVLLTNDGTGRFSADDLAFTTGDKSAGIALGDVNGDGRLDAYFGNRQQDRLALNDGTGAFVEATLASLPAESVIAAAVEMVDANLDGHLDVMIAMWAADDVPDTLYLNDGDGVFQDVTSTHMPLTLDFAYDLAVGDFDEDGDPDAFLGCSSGIRLLVNGGTGVFSEAPSAVPDFSAVDAVALGDVDRDLDLDVLLGTATVGPTGELLRAALLLNDGSGGFVDATAAAIPPLPPEVPGGSLEAAVLADFDGDGAPDFLIGNSGGGSKRRNHLYRNDGTGTFAFDGEGLPKDQDQTFGLAAGDLDGDGDVDVLAANGWDGDIGQGLPNRAYVNLTRQIAWRALPRVGKTLTMELFGAPHDAWILALSQGVGELPLPPFGVLRLDPATLLLLGSGALDGDGRGALAHDVPPDPSLLGWTAHCQALFGSPGALSNREAIHLTGF